MCCRNDIAIMKLSQPIYDNGYVGIAELPGQDQMLPHNFDCHITGWGYIDSEDTLANLEPHIWT